jgi:hypothetical protein
MLRATAYESLGQNGEAIGDYLCVRVCVCVCVCVCVLYVCVFLFFVSSYRCQPGRQAWRR